MGGGLYHVSGESFPPSTTDVRQSVVGNFCSPFSADVVGRSLFTGRHRGDDGRRQREGEPVGCRPRAMNKKLATPVGRIFPIDREHARKREPLFITRSYSSSSDSKSLKLKIFMSFVPL